MGLAGLGLTGLAFFVWTQTGDKRAMWALIGCLVLTIIGLLVNIQVKTYREQLIATLDDIADAVKQNNHERAFSFVDATANPTLLRLKAELPNFKFSDARVTAIKSITIEDDKQPPTSLVEFNAVARVSSAVYSGPVARFVKAYFKYEKGRWLVTDYSHDNPQAGFIRDDNSPSDD